MHELPPHASDEKAARNGARCSCQSESALRGVAIHARPADGLIRERRRIAVASRPFDKGSGLLFPRRLGYIGKLNISFDELLNVAV